MTTAEHIMTDHFVVVRPETTVGRAIGQMLDEHAGLVAIVDSDGRLNGTLPDTVILRAALDTHLRQDPISLHMLRQFATISPQAPVDLVLDQFVLHDMEVLPVAVDGRISGVIERMDLLRAVLGTTTDADHGDRPGLVKGVVER